MKREKTDTDQEWSRKLEARKAIAESRMREHDAKVGFDEAAIKKAAHFWYGRACIDNCCRAENRLMRGEYCPALS